MKASEITDATIELPNAQIVVELPNGQRVATSNYYHDDSARGEPIIVVKTGRKLTK